MNPFFELLRVKDWYKNVTVFIGIIFVVFLLNLKLTQSLIVDSLLIIFLSCLVSSVNYMLNALVDMKFDKKHPFKKFRPLPAKKIHPKTAFAVMSILLIVSLGFSYLYFGFYPTFFLILLVIAAIFYNVKPIRFKDIPYLDVISESVNNPIRFLIGWSVFTSIFPNILILIFVWVSACFLMTRKRLIELILFKEKAAIYRSVFKYYSTKSLRAVMSFYVFASVLILVIIIYNGIL
jgi:decaprenyl-phosphate phosphoribosyltransferase